MLYLCCKRVISLLQARYFVKRGFLSYYARIHATSIASPISLDFVCIFSTFMDIFPSDFLDMPLYYNIDFSIDVESSKKPTFIPLY